MSDALRNAFEAYFADSRRGKGASKAPTFARLADGTYADDPTQRHWWTWQNAARAALSAPPPVVPADMEPTEYALGAAQIVSRKQANGSKLWAVRDDFGNVLNSAGEWEWEPMPSGRDDAFLTRCRFASPLAARDAYMRHIAAAPQAPTQREGD